ncbi:MAG: translation elongation factor Ts [Bacteroidales bacterium]|nr:elongation factor Ts [Bacteroidales bacterium]MCR5714908.1 translation elongation factor Ts [Bacteroidales bacterium]
MAVTAADVAKLRKLTGAGMMDCKKALVEADGDQEKAIEIIRKKGQLIANKRADRTASEGCVLAKVSADGKTGVVAVLNCETDFVAQNADFVRFTQDIVDLALQQNPADLEALLALRMGGITVAEGVNDRMAAIGEKIELSFYQKISAEQVVAYVHPGNRLACVVGFSKPLADIQVGKDVAMQVAAMNPIAVDKALVPADVVAKEREIAVDQTKNDPKNANKPAAIIERIAEGKLEKFFKESTLLNQEFIKDGKMNVRQYIESADKDLQVTGFARYALAI